MTWFGNAWSPTKVKHHRKRYNSNTLDLNLPEGIYVPQVITEEHDGPLIGSRVASGLGNLHCPVLDLDFECKLLPSSTAGHYHLYMDGVTLDDSQYRLLIDVLAHLGIIERGVQKQVVDNGMTLLRHPDHPKQGPRATCVNLEDEPF